MAGYLWWRAKKNLLYCLFCGAVIADYGEKTGNIGQHFDNIEYNYSKLIFISIGICKLNEFCKLYLGFISRLSELGTTNLLQ